MADLLAPLETIPFELLAPFIVIGLFAQLVDGALGAGFGMVSQSLLLSLGLPPAAATAATHGVESFTSGASGLAHAAQRNIDWALFARLVVPGIIGGIVGVWLLTMSDLAILQPILLVYMAAVGTYLIWRAPRRAQSFRRKRFVRTIGLAGGLLDATGGGWGPVVTSNLISQGLAPRIAIGTSNAAEFFVTVTILSAWIGSLGLESFSHAAIGLLIGGLIGAPCAAYLTRRLPSKALTIAVGAILIGLSLVGVVSLVVQPQPAFPRF